MTISIIAAIAKNNAIGKDNDLIWHISEDLKRFKKLTSGHTIIMGRKTYESLPFKPLPNRKNIILSGKTDLKFERAIVANSIEDALKECESEDEIFICGGATVYKKFIDIADKMYLTEINQEFDGDTFFPDYNQDNWKIKLQSEKYTDEKSNIEYKFIDYIRQF